MIEQFQVVYLFLCAWVDVCYFLLLFFLEEVAALLPLLELVGEVCLPDEVGLDGLMYECVFPDVLYLELKLFLEELKLLALFLLVAQQLVEDGQTLRHLRQTFGVWNVELPLRWLVEIAAP